MAGWTEQDIARHLGSQFVGTTKPADQLEPKQRSLYRSKTEAAYAHHLELERRAGFIASWKYEVMTLKLANGVRYTPDFVVETKPGVIELHEVKGRKGITFWTKPVSRVKFTIASEMFPYWPLRVVFPGSRPGTWDHVEFHEGTA